MKKSLEKFAYVKDTLYLCIVKRRGKIFDREEPYVWEQKTLWLQEKSLYSVGETHARASGRRMRGRREDARGCQRVGIGRQRGDRGRQRGDRGRQRGDRGRQRVSLM